MTKSATNHKVKIRSQHIQHIKLLFGNKISFLRVESDKINRDRTYLKTTNTKDDTSEVTEFSARIFHPSNNFHKHRIIHLEQSPYSSDLLARMKIMLILASSTAIVCRHDNALIHAPVIHNSVPISMSQN